MTNSQATADLQNCKIEHPSCLFWSLVQYLTSDGYLAPASHFVTEWYIVAGYRVRTLAAHRRARLNEAQTLHQFFRDIDDEEAWIKYVVDLNVPDLKLDSTRRATLVSWCFLYMLVIKCFDSVFESFVRLHLNAHLTGGINCFYFCLGYTIQTIHLHFGIAFLPEFKSPLMTEHWRNGVILWPRYNYINRAIVHEILARSPYIEVPRSRIKPMRSTLPYDCSNQSTTVMICAHNNYIPESQLFKCFSVRAFIDLSWLIKW